MGLEERMSSSEELCLDTDILLGIGDDGTAAWGTGVPAGEGLAGGTTEFCPLRPDEVENGELSNIARTEVTGVGL